MPSCAQVIESYLQTFSHTSKRGKYDKQKSPAQQKKDARARGHALKHKKQTAFERDTRVLKESRGDLRTPDQIHAAEAQHDEDIAYELWIHEEMENDERDFAIRRLCELLLNDPVLNPDWRVLPGWGRRDFVDSDDD